ncbi:MAG: DUF4157 domain-containing protein [Planctomycetes bacterium]|nr:DUF4157 domain-containing protein [Planctomycetota bacterium]
MADLWGRDDEFLRTRRVQANVAEEIVAPPIVNEVLRSPGQPLTPDTSAFMESRFGHDFSRVQVHTDAKAVESARAINARAYTAGQHLVFGTSQYITGTIEGRRLLAHELTHIVQQGRNIGTSVNKQPIHRQVDINGAANQLIDQGSQPTKDKCAGWKRDCQSFCIKVTKQAYRDIEGSNPPPSKHID